MSKKLLAIVAVMAALTLTVSAAYAEMTMEVGAKAGLNIANITGDDTDDLDTRMGVIGGGFFGLGFNENFGARVEVLYAMRGAEFTETVDVGGTDVTVDGKVKLDYIEIPLLAVGMFPASDAVTITAFAGPAFGIAVTREGEAEAAGESETVDLDDEIKSFDIGGTFGAGAMFVVGSVNLTIEGRATIGFTNINEDLEDDPDTTSIDESTIDVGSNQNFTFGFLLGIVVPLGNGE
jgi:hypothetical protein